jgi:hypothetical protein
MEILPFVEAWGLSVLHGLGEMPAVRIAYK